MSGYTQCPKCDGHGVVSTGYCPPCDIAHTADCDLCGGIGEVRADVAVDYLESQVRT
jgi:hypothetical protein